MDNKLDAREDFCAIPKRVVTGEAFDIGAIDGSLLRGEFPP